MKGLDCLVNNASVFENDNLINFSEKSFLNLIKKINYTKFNYKQIKNLNTIEIYKNICIIKK